MIKFIPTSCTECGHGLKITKGKNDKYKLVCTNADCGGVSIKKFQKGMTSFGISGIGPAICVKLHNSGVKDIVDLLTFTEDDFIKGGEFKEGKSLDKMIESIKSFKNIKLSNIIESLQIDGIGKSVSKEIEKYLLTGSYDPTGMQYNIRDQIEDMDSDLNKKIKDILDRLKIIGIDIMLEKNNDEPKTDKTIRIIEMTGSPKMFGFDTKGDFSKSIESYGFIQGTLNKDCHFLVTDDISSKTSKMLKAQKLGVSVVTYGQLIDLVKTF